MQIRAQYEYHIPTSLCEAAELVLKGGMVMAGGSDVMPQLKMDTIHPADLVDLSKISELKGIEEKEDGIHIGSMTTLVKIAKDPMILEKAPILSRAARNVASPQIRNRGTIGGNVLQARRCFYYNQTREWRSGIPVCKKVGGDICIQAPKSPTCRAIYYSDMAPALIACEALAKVHTAEGVQVLKVCDLAEKHCADALGSVLIEEFLIPKNAYEGAAASFAKYSLRGSIDFPIVNFACVIGADEEVRFTAGAIATRVLRLENVEAYIKEQGKAMDPVKASEIAETEMREKCQLIREAGLSVQVKRMSFKQVHEILEEISRQLNK